MSTPSTVPGFAVLGVVNEGKTSVVATLSEDPNVKPDPTPGATIRCEAYPIKIGGREVLRLYDTPGFQNSVRALAWLREQEKARPAGTDLLALFRQAQAHNESFFQECELFRPIVEDNAGILYVVDGSSPVTRSYQAEMEMLRLSGRPRMALINHKGDGNNYLPQWENELGRYFNLWRHFNAHQATQRDRLDLLLALQQIDSRPVWKQGFEQAIAAFKQRWELRRIEAANAIVRMVADCVGHVERANYRFEAEIPTVELTLKDDYRKKVAAIERRAHETLLKIFEHEIDLDALEGVDVNLWSEQTWTVLGLPESQLVWAGTIAGALAGYLVDLATLHTTVIFGTLIGGAIGGASAKLGGKQLAKVKISRVGGYWGYLFPNGEVGGSQLQASCRNVDFGFILLDRVLLLYSELVDRAHALKASIKLEAQTLGEITGMTHKWAKNARETCIKFAEMQHERTIKNPFGKSRAEIEQDFFGVISNALKGIGGH